MSKQEMLNEILQIIARVTEHDISVVTEDTGLVGELNLSSLEILVILTEVENRFHVSVPVVEYKTIITVGDYIDVVMRYMNG